MWLLWQAERCDDILHALSLFVLAFLLIYFLFWTWFLGYAFRLYSLHLSCFSRRCLMWFGAFNFILLFFIWLLILVFFSGSCHEGSNGALNTLGNANCRVSQSLDCALSSLLLWFFILISVFCPFFSKSALLKLLSRHFTCSVFQREAVYLRCFLLHLLNTLFA